MSDSNIVLLMLLLVIAGPGLFAFLAYDLRRRRIARDIDFPEPAPSTPAELATLVLATDLGDAQRDEEKACAKRLAEHTRNAWLSPSRADPHRDDGTRYQHPVLPHIPPSVIGVQQAARAELDELEAKYKAALEFETGQLAAARADGLKYKQQLIEARALTEDNRKLASAYENSVVIASNSLDKARIPRRRRLKSGRRAVAVYQDLQLYERVELLRQREGSVSAETAAKIAAKMKQNLVETFKARGLVACQRAAIPGAEDAGTVIFPTPDLLEKLAEDYGILWAQAFDEAISEFGRNKVFIDRPAPLKV